MTNATLVWGSAFLAFGPLASLLFGIVYQKAQLVIVVTTSAFFFLLSTLGASLIWIVFDAIGIQNQPMVILLPGVFFQFLLRCAFVKIYHKVEKVIEVSIDHHEAMQQQRQTTTTTDGNNNNNNNNNNDTTTTNNNNTNNNNSDSALLRLELNDWACGLAAGVGFGGMHAVLLYGTLLATESRNLGTLYQDACPSMPGLFLSAWNAFFFSILDIIWMFLTFFGMRRRESPGTEEFGRGGRGTYLGNTTKSGNLALAMVAVTHVAASMATTPNYFGGGCRVSLPLLAAIVAGTVTCFIGGVVRIYLPADQKRRGSTTHVD
mmetsp:Transcript_26139/g.43587  ORF Transcript_26139/g.43587 Transcript_26139/m.43587 type:complete len:319 (-) Transcript_26139:251-1207(-)|eukprot:CAMPEP_0119005470 /NCGR_PEP_ID=MMETSP1176-20130426/1740_1 /TAXON_ID=265551 /ORGANISM="Synedropsis recta cf, Strain CCMP1620" /LENGTH=318 /DNA_ID=CAMNT_0006957283 /DNA_START=78 /DNA_END=1034 /DNA_ORIENTATION=-